MKNRLYNISMMIVAIAATSVTVATSVTGQEKAIKNPARTGYVVSGSIRWSRTYGVIPAGPGNSQAAASPCGQFFVAATVPSTGKGVVTTSEMTLNTFYNPNMYICSYKLKVPGNTPLYMIAGMGGTLLLPKMDESPQYLTDSWIGGSYSKPPPGTFRTFTGSQSVNLSPTNPTTIVNFEMIYARKDNPK